MPPSKLFAPLLCIALLLALPPLASALSDNANEPPGRSGRPQGPPPEFATACEGKQVGEKVVIKTPRGDSIEATCEQRGDTLSARPLNPPPPPPPEKKER